LNLLDTTVAIDHLRGLPAATDFIGQLLDTDTPLVASEITRFELVAGLREDESPGLEDFFRVVVWAPVSEPIARTAGGFARQYRRSHSGIDDADYLIAATALELEAQLLTTNARHFPMFPDLEPAY
jgi:predicted nucleic acid-binding protein